MGFFWSSKFLLVLIVISAVPIGYILHVETRKAATEVYEYHSHGWLRECTKWDAANGRFLVTFMEGGVGEIVVPDDYAPGRVLEEKMVVKDAELAGNASVGFTIDRPRNRILVAATDLFGNRYSAVAAYDLTSWKRLFLTQLSGPGEGKTFADDVAVDAEGNSYITDAKGSKIWKVSLKGELIGIINSPLFTHEKWYKNLVSLNGITYHPNGYLLVIHTASGSLYKVEIGNNGDHRHRHRHRHHGGVTLVDVVEGSLLFGDGLQLLSPPTKLVVAGMTTRLVESSDDWKTARVVGSFKAVAHRLTTASTLKDGKVFLNHLIGFGYPKRKHLLVEAVF